MNWPCLFLAIVGLMSPVVSRGQGKKDEEALRHLPTAFCDAWARHDAHELARIMAEDVDFVTVGATWLHGREDFEKYHSRLLTGRFKESTNTPLKTSVRFLGPGSALFHWSWSISGDRSLDGSARPTRFGLMTMLARKRKGAWMVAAAQNTNSASTVPPEAEGINSPIAVPREPGSK